MNPSNSANGNGVRVAASHDDFLNLAGKVAEQGAEIRSLTSALVEINAAISRIADKVNRPTDVRGMMIAAIALVTLGIAIGSPIVSSIYQRIYDQRETLRTISLRIDEQVKERHAREISSAKLLGRLERDVQLIYEQQSE